MRPDHTRSASLEAIDGAQKFRGARLETGPSIAVKASYGVTVSVTAFGLTVSVAAFELTLLVPPQVLVKTARYWFVLNETVGLVIASVPVVTPL